MVAQKSRLRLTLMLIGLFALLSGSATGQQTPSQRYQPNRDGFAPPSVHVAPQQMQKIPPKFRGSNAYYQSSPATKQPAFAGAKYTFSDQNASHTERRSSARSGSESQTQTQVPFETGTIQQTSYQVDEEGRPVVPAILAGGTNPAPAKSSSQFQPPSSPDDGLLMQDAPPKTPDDFAAAMNQARGQSPRIAPGELASQSQDISAQMAEFRRRAEEKANAQALAAKSDAENREIARLENQKRESERLQIQKLQSEQAAAEKLAAANSEAVQRSATQSQELQISATRENAAQMATQRITAENVEADRNSQVETEAANEISASEFIGSIASNPPGKTEAPIQDNNTAPKLVAKQAVKSLRSCSWRKIHSRAKLSRIRRYVPFHPKKTPIKPTRLSGSVHRLWKL